MDITSPLYELSILISGVRWLTHTHTHTHLHSEPATERAKMVEIKEGKKRLKVLRAF